MCPAQSINNGELCERKEHMIRTAMDRQAKKRWPEAVQYVDKSRAAAPTTVGPEHQFIMTGWP